MILVTESTKVFHLKTPNTSYIFRLNGDYILEHLYWGKRIEDITGLIDKNTFIPAFSAINYEYHEDGIELTTDSIASEYAFYGSCDMRKPSFHAVYFDGSRVSKPKFVSYKIYSGKKKINGLPSVYTEDDS